VLNIKYLHGAEWDNLEWACLDIEAVFMTLSRRSFVIIVMTPESAVKMIIVAA